MKFYVTVVEIDASVYAHVDVDLEGNVPREIAEHKICQYHVAKYVASGLYDDGSPECKACTVQSSDVTKMTDWLKELPDAGREYHKEDPVLLHFCGMIWQPKIDELMDREKEEEESENEE